MALSKEESKRTWIREEGVMMKKMNKKGMLSWGHNS